MDVISNPVLDFKTLTAIVTANPEGMAIIGAWNGMETLAREDPEGCVRLCPGLPMDNSALAMKREKDRIRKAKSRARQKQAGMTETENNVTPRDRCDTKCDKRDRCDGERDTCNNRRDIACDTCDTTPEIPVVTAFPITCNSRCDTPSAVTTPYDSNNNINPLHPLQAHKPVSKYADLQNLIPLHKLPEEYRHVIAEWNKLPLPKFRGLVPELLEKLKYLMQRYGETLLCKTIAGIAGKVDLFFKNDCTRTISLNEKDVY